MADPTVDVVFPSKEVIKDFYSYQIKNGLQLYIGQLVKLSSGFLDKHAAGSGTVCLGMVAAPGIPGGDPNVDAIVAPNALAPGNTSLAAGLRPEAVVFQGERFLDRITLAVAGTLAGTIADVGTIIYAGSGSSNLADLSTTQTSSDKPIGEIVNFWATAPGTKAIYDIRFYSYEARRGM